MDLPRLCFLPVPVPTVRLAWARVPCFAFRARSLGSSDNLVCASRHAPETAILLPFAASSVPMTATRRAVRNSMTIRRRFLFCLALLLALDASAFDAQTAPKPDAAPGGFLSVPGSKMYYQECNA